MAALDKNAGKPSDEFVRAMLDAAGIEGRRTNRLVQEHAPIVAEAFQVFVDRMILERVGFAEREDLVKMRTAAPVSAESEIVSAPAEIEPNSERDGGGIITTEMERMFFDYARTRLSFLVRDERLFSAIRHVGNVDKKTVFTVFYKQERKGRLFNFREGSGDRLVFDFPQGSAEPKELQEIYDMLLGTFRQRVEELGV